MGIKKEMPMISLETKFPTGRFLINLRLCTSAYPHRISMISNHNAPDVYTGREQDGLNLSSGMRSLHTVSINLTVIYDL